MSENEQAGKIMDYIDSQNKILTITDVSKWTRENKCFKTFTQGIEIFEKIIIEHNNNIKKD